MNFDLSPEQRRLRDKARAFSESTIAPVAARYDREEIYPQDILLALGPTGLMAPHPAT